MYKIWENIYTILNNPQAILKNFQKAMTDINLPYSIAKTVAYFEAPFSAAVVGLPQVNIINAASYPESEHFMVCGIRAFQGAAAALGSTPWTAGISDAIAQNGSFSINNNGSVELKDMPLTTFQTGTNFPDSGLMLLEKPIWWIAQTQLTAQLTFPTNPATANLNMRFSLMGIKLI